MRIVRKIVKFGILLSLILTVLLVLWLAFLSKTRLPVLDSTLTHASLKGEVRTLRDDWGVPHIFADTETDAYFALGYVMGQDRLFQMELMRRLARGELAELLGPPVVPVDRIVRAFRLRANAEEYVRTKLGLHPEMQAAAEAFIAGINHRMRQEPLPFEYVVLGIPARPFTLVDCLTVAAILPITFADGIRLDPLMSMLKQQYPDLDIEALFPGYSKGVHATIMESLEEAEAYLNSQKEQKQEAVPASAPPAEEDLVAALGPALDALQSLSDLFGPQVGSNSWVLAPSRTVSGNALLANDPHIAFTNPSIWYEAHMKYGDYENYGFHLPLIPFPLIGHNRDRGWALTMFANDDVDLYVERFDPENPTRVMHRGEWQDARVEIETIKVRFGKTVQHEVRITPHGPVVTDLFKLLMGYDGPDVSLSWVWQHVEYTDILGFYLMSHARTVEPFGDAVSLLTSPGINVSYADRAGNIAWWAGGKIPIRPEHVNPKMLLDGASGADEVLGYVPFEENPHLINPPWGYIVTANNMSTVKPVGALPQLQGYWQPEDRAARIEHLLDSREKWDIPSTMTAQFDDTAHAAPGVVRGIREVLDSAAPALPPIARQAYEILCDWDFSHGTDKAGASIYQVTCQAISRNALEDEMGEKLFRSYSTLADHWNFFKHFIHDDDSPFWNDIRTDARETRADIVRKAFGEAVAWLENELGSDPHAWAWGRIHTIEFKHPFGYLPLLGRIFNIGPFPASGATQVVNNMLYQDYGHNFSVIAGPSTRRIIDFADPENSVAVLPTGNAGNFMSKHYADQAELFVSGQYRQPRFTQEQIDAHTRHMLLFKPAS